MEGELYIGSNTSAGHKKGLVGAIKDRRGSQNIDKPLYG